MKYNYKLVRSDRRTMSITVTADNSITVRAPYGADEKKIENFVISKSAWLDKRLNANKRVLDVNSSVRLYETVLIAGNNVPLAIGGGSGFKDGVVYVKNLADLPKVLCGSFGGEFIERFNGLSEKYRFKVNSVGFRSYKARWGCCDSLGNIIFNYKILMLPADIQNYVIVHELSHTKVMNHSAAFWAEVSRCMPDYSERRKRLKSYAFIPHMYP